MSGASGKKHVFSFPYKLCKEMFACPPDNGIKGVLPRGQSREATLWFSKLRISAERKQHMKKYRSKRTTVTLGILML